MGVHAKQIQVDIQSCIILYIVRWVALAMTILFVTSTTIEDNISLQDVIWQFQFEGGGGGGCAHAVPLLAFLFQLLVQGRHSWVSNLA